MKPSRQRIQFVPEKLGSTEFEIKEDLWPRSKKYHVFFPPLSIGNFSGVNNFIIRETRS